MKKHIFIINPTSGDGKYQEILDLQVFTFTFSHLADAFVQSDVQGREYSSYEQQNLV